MAIPKHIANYHNAKHDLTLKIREDANVILDTIDLAKLLEDPKMYLEMLGTAFIERHEDKFKTAFSMGRKHGEKISGNNVVQGTETTEETQ
tara:strand:- start:266 stop:538 length:273 start_codon:yes stop_codon:yes gene_type:complete